jgi:tRNA(Leu) C34 or U34 (ribose-2'-O)-methylase TrmL
MATKSTTELISEGKGPRSFGAFYPTGHIVIFFANKGDAERAREALLTGGYEDNEIVVLSSDEAALCTEDMLPHVSLLAFGSETRHMREHLELAKQGCDKLIVYAPTEHEAGRVMNVARHFDIRLAEKYHRLAIEHLKES